MMEQMLLLCVCAILPFVIGALVAINHPNASFLYQNALWAQIETSNNSVKTCASWGPSRYGIVCNRVKKVLSSIERAVMIIGAGPVGERRHFWTDPY